MGKALKLVNKLERRSKSVKTAASSFDRYDKAGRSEEVMAKSPKAYQLARKIKRKLDKKFGQNMLADEPKVSKRVKVDTLERFDFDPGAGTDFGMRLTFASGLIADIGLQVGDIVRILHGSLKGSYLRVTALSSSTQVRLEDVASFGAAENNIHCRFQISDVKSSYK